MTNKIFSSFFCVAFCIFGCSTLFSNKEEQAILKAEIYPIVVILDKPPKNEIFQIRENGPYLGAKDYKLSYFDDNLIRNYIVPDYENNGDTIHIATGRERLELAHNIRNLDIIHFYLRQGDTLLISYQGQAPVPKLLNRDTRTYDLDYDIRKAEFVNEGDYSAIMKRSAMSLFFNYSPESNVPMIDQIRSFDQELLDQAYVENEKERSFLDSIFQSNRISEKEYHFYSKNIEFKKRQLDYVNRNLANKEHLNEFYMQYDSEWLGMLEFRKAFNKYIDHFAGLHHIPVIRKSNGQAKDYCVLYDSIVVSKSIEENLKQMALYNCLERILNKYPVSDSKHYIKLYEQQFNDTVRSDILVKKYKLDIPVQNDLLLKDKDGKAYQYTEIIEQSEGKVIYVDFWASWCGPCIKALPYSFSLHNDYEEVLFIYLSIDDSFEKWQKSIKKHGLEEKEHSYFIENRHTSSLLENLSLDVIPRYLMYNKRGDLEHKNAPGPKGSDIRELLERHVEM